MNRSPRIALGFVCSVLLSVACSGDDENPHAPGREPDAGTPADGAVDAADGTDAGSPLDAGSADSGTDAGGGTSESPLDAPLEEFCAGSGSVVTVPTPGGDACLGDVAEQAFRFAVCSCTTLTWSGTLETDSFDSATGQSGEGASVGANQGASSSSRYDIGGSLWAGAPGLAVTGSGRIANDAHTGGGFSSTAPQNVGGDLFSDGAVGKYIDVAGSVHVPAGTTLDDVNAAGGVVEEPVSIAEPCSCNDPVVDPAAIVDFVKARNDNEVSEIVAASLTGFTDPQTLDLPCGRYFFDAIAGSATLTFKLAGRTVVTVDSDLALSGAFQLELAEGAELDLFVRGNVDLTGSNVFGDVDTPARIRVYAAGTRVKLSGGTRLGGNVYAPNAELTSSGNIEVSGALFGQKVAFTGETTVHYDEAILDVPGCDPPTDECGDCNDCNGAAPACIDGTCGACTTNADCCPPLVCHEGACVTEIL